MIGLYGIIGNKNIIDRSIIKNAFSKMTDDISNKDFNHQSVCGNNFSIGITKRSISENNDLALKCIENDFVIGFWGYGKFIGEERLFWAEEMLDRIVSIFLQEGKNIFTKIEGSFHCLIYHNSEIIMVSDRFGSKNCYFYDTNDVLVFAPDVNRILASTLPPKHKNIDAAIQLLISGFFLDNNTLVKNISRFPFATLLSKNINISSKSRLKKYWTPPKYEGHVDNITDELVEEFSNKMRQAIYELADLEERSIVTLSAGYDSRTIACFLSKKQELNIINYGIGEEHHIAMKICKALKGNFHYFSNEMIRSNYFKEELKKLILEQRIHAVVNQFFNAPLFKKYFTTNSNNVAIYNGIYMDILFSAPYTYKEFDLNHFIGTYGDGIPITKKFSPLLREKILCNLMNDIYNNMSTYLGDCDGVGKSQLSYIQGRLRRYVNEYFVSIENYCYMFSPGFNYDLVDFGFQLSLKLRKGVLYNEMMNKNFPNIMKIRCKDSYGNRDKSIIEKISSSYLNFKVNLSLATRGRIQFSPVQKYYYFLKMNGIDDYRDIFLNNNSIEELFDEFFLPELFKLTKKKHYLLEYFERVLFLKQFYSMHEF